MFTTSRYASGSICNLARVLAKENHESYIARGKRTIFDLVSIARISGVKTITILEDRKHGLVQYRILINETGGWSWE